MSIAIEVARLGALGRLWGKAKLFHPYLATRDIDWDAALIGALPKVRSANTAEQYRAAIEAMLAALGDPETRTSSAARQIGAPPPVAKDDRVEPVTEYFRVANGVVVLCCSEIASLFARAGSNDALQLAAPSLEAEIGKAKGIVLDCRLAAPRSAAVDFAFHFIFGNYVREVLAGLIDRPVTLGTHRFREHSGHAPHTGFSSGGYGSALAVATPAVLQGRGRPGECPPLAAIVDARTPDQRALLGGLQSAGLLTVVHEDAGGSSAGASDQDAGMALDMGEGITARLRTTEFVDSDGRAGWEPDVRVVAADRGETGRDAALDAALESIAGSAPAQARGPEPAAPPRGQSEKAYAETALPDADHRLLTLFRFWTVIEHFFPYKHLMDRDWSSVVAEFIPKLEANRTALGYQRTVTELAVHLQDSHVNVAGAQALEEHLGLFSPPLNLSLVEGETVVTAVRDGQAASSAGVAVGDVILAIDGEPVAERRRRAAKLMPASTPQALNRAVNGRLLRGPKDSVARLVVRGADRREREAAIARSSPWRSVAFPPDRDTPSVFAVLPSGHGYIDLDRLAIAEVDKAMAAVAGAPGLIFDIRGYPQGTGFRIAPRLAVGNGRVVGALFRRPYWRGDWIGSGDAPAPEHLFDQPLASANGPRYSGKVVVLINEQAQSQSEHTCMAFAAATDATFIGSPTAGANGDITNFVLPGNLVVTFTGHDVRHPDGRQLQRVGIQPHIRIEPTITGIREGRDEVLEAAVRHLQTGA